MFFCSTFGLTQIGQRFHRFGNRLAHVQIGKVQLKRAEIFTFQDQLVLDIVHDSSLHLVDQRVKNLKNKNEWYNEQELNCNDG